MHGSHVCPYATLNTDPVIAMLKRSSSGILSKNPTRPGCAIHIVQPSKAWTRGIGFFLSVILLLSSTGWTGSSSSYPPHLTTPSEEIQPPRNLSATILFVRGGPGTGGFLEGGSDDQLSSIFDESTANGNHGWATLADVLENLGFTLEEMREEPVVDGVPTPIPFDQMDLSVYTTIVLGSNNAEYTVAQIDAIEDYVRSGGSVLFISDANFGQDWPDAPFSDQAFLDRFGLIMNQDQGTYAITDDEYRNTPHPILDGVSAFDGEGVSPVTVGDVPSDVRVEILAGAEGNVRRNDSESGRGSSTAATADDAALLYGSAGSGRFAVHFDRNTFFNENGAGTDITRLDNQVFAENLFRWLDGQTPLPVDVTQFRGVFDGDDVVLSWASINEVDLSGYSINRRGAYGRFKAIGFTPARPGSESVKRYQWIDPVPERANEPLEYRLRSIDIDGTERVVGTLRMRTNHTTTGIEVLSPSPLVATANIEIHVERTADVDLAVYDILGRRVVSLYRGEIVSGTHSLSFSTNRLSPGRYFVRLRSEGQVTTHAVSIVR